MKAKIKETGEIVDVYYEPQHGQKTNIFKEAVWVNGRTWQEDELEFEQNTLSAAEPVDLENEAVAFCFDNGINITPYQATRIAHHFYELGRKARKEE